MLLQTFNHLAVHKGVFRRVVDFNLQTAAFNVHLNLKVRMRFQKRHAVVVFGAGVENRQTATTEDFVQAGFGLVTKLLGFFVGEDLQGAGRAN